MNTFPTESERYVVSSAMQDMDCYAEAVEKGITEDVFFDNLCRTIWLKINEMVERREDVSITSLHKHLDLEAHDIASVYTTAASVRQLDWHTEQVVTAARLRKLKRIAADILSEVDVTEEPQKLIDRVEGEVLSVRTVADEKNASRGQILMEIMDDFERALQNGLEPAGLCTGFTHLDQMINGLEPGKLYIIAARPAMGKTALLGNIVEHQATKAGNGCLFISAEMSEKELLKRFVFGHAGVSLSELVELGQKPSKGQFAAIRKATELFLKSPIHIYDKSGPTIAGIRAKARRLKRKGELGMIAVDYLQLLRASGKAFSRENEINQISQGLKALSKDMSCPVVCLAQLNRGPENRAGEAYGIPRMSDLRESGAIEQDADVISLLYRPGYYDKENEKLRNVGKLIIAKNRSGATGTLDLEWTPSTMRFTEPTMNYTT